MRDSGASMTQIRAMLSSHGIGRSHRGVQVMLANRAYLGEIHFGKWHNTHAHDAIIDEDLFERVQRRVVPRGPRGDSDRLLARLGVLRCGSCGARLGSMKLPKQNDYPIYRCPSTSDCDRHVTISAVIAEKVVTKRVREATWGIKGSASNALDLEDAKQELAAAEKALANATRKLIAAGIEDEPTAVEMVTRLRDDRDAKKDRVERLDPSRKQLKISADDNWDDLTLDERRTLIRANVHSAVVAPSGRGPDRITVKLFDRSGLHEVVGLGQ